MKYLLHTIIFILLAMFLSGCLMVNTKVYLNPDGSGTIEERVLMKDSFVEMFQGFMEAFTDSTEEPEKFSLFDEEELREDAEKYGDGVTYESGKEITIEGWQGSIAVYKFDDISKVKLNPDPEDKVSLGMEETDVETDDEPEEENEYLQFKFEEGDLSRLTIIFPEQDFEMDDDEETELDTLQDSGDMGEEILRLMEGMQISVSIEFDGEITETNATYVEDSEITLLDVDFTKLLENEEKFEELKEKKPETLAEFKEIVKEVPGIRIEFEEEVQVNFK